MHIVTMVITMTGHSHSRVVHVIERTLNGRIIFHFLASHFLGLSMMC